MVDESEDAIVLLDSQRTIIYSNQSFQKIFNLSSIDYSGKPYEDLFTAHDMQGQCNLGEDVKSGKSCSYHGIFILSRITNETSGPFCISCTPFQAAADETRMIVFKDMAPLAEYIDKIEKFGQWVEDERNYLNEILDGIADGYYITGPDRRIIRVNQKLITLLGASEEQIVGKRCRDVLLSGKCDQDCPLEWVSANHKPIIHSPEIITGHDGRRLFIRKSTFPLRDHQHKITGFLCIIYDYSELETLRHKVTGFNLRVPLISNNKRMLEIIELISFMRDTDPYVLLTGESGTGKEILANAIVESGPRRNRPYLKINCSALPEGLLESELFGHRKGAFTGAISDKLGKFTMAHNGTILLDEIGDMPMGLQAKVLRVLENGEFQAVGSTGTEKVNVRIIAATNRDLSDLIREKKFREDLFYRLCVVPIEIPPLRDRKEDIGYLIRYFIAHFNEKYTKKVNDVSARTYAMLMDYGWPGNIRELRNAIEHAFACARGDTLERSHFPLYIRRSVNPYHDQEAGNLPQTGNLDRQVLVELLRKFKGNRHQTAQALNISRTTLWRKIKSYQIKEFE